MKISKLISSVAAVASVALAGLNASASTLLTSTTYGGHTYELWDSLHIGWEDAKNEAVAAGGYLAVLTDAAETTAVYNGLIGNGFFQAVEGQDNEAWLGGYPADGSHSTTDRNNWAWVTGEAWTAFDRDNFAGGEPNGDSGGLTINRFANSFWNDDTVVGGYIVEKNGVPDAGSTLALLSGAIAALGAARRIRK